MERTDPDGHSGLASRLFGQCHINSLTVLTGLIGVREDTGAERGGRNAEGAGRQLVTSACMPCTDRGQGPIPLVGWILLITVLDIVCSTLCKKAYLVYDIKYLDSWKQGLAQVEVERTSLDFELLL